MRYFYSLIILSLSLSASSEAGELRCNISAITKCLCEAPMIVQCGDKFGHIKKTTKVSKLKFLITNSNGSTRDYVLKNPQGAAGDYISLDNELLKKKVDLKAGETIAIAENGLIIDSSTILYEDHHAKKELGTISSAPSSSEYCTPFENEKPMLLIYPGGCGENKLCAMKVKCYPASFVEDAVCPANKDGSCPSATKCAFENEVTLSRKSEKPIPGSENSSRDKSGSSQQ